MEGNDLLADLGAFLAEYEPELIEFRRDLHAHPELAFNETRTTRQVALRLAAAGRAWRLARFAIVGGSGVLVNLVVLAVLLRVTSSAIGRGQAGTSSRP